MLLKGFLIDSQILGRESVSDKFTTSRLNLGPGNTQRMGRQRWKMPNVLLTHLEGDDHPGGGDALVGAGGALERTKRAI